MGVLSQFLSLFQYELPGCHYAIQADRSQALDLKSGGTELIIGLIVVVPICMLVSICSKRFVVGTHRSKMTSALLFVVVGDLLLDAWLPSSECLSLTSAFATENHIVCLVVAIRLICVYVGTYIGESFVPVALTGSIGTGKSTVADMLLTNKEGQTSFTIIDTDKIGHEILIPPSIIEENGERYSISASDSVFLDILDAFGDKAVEYKNILDDDERIDRRKLGAIIFQNASQRRKLNRITHPRIISCMLKQIIYNIYARRPYRIVCADVPLLYESGKLKWLFAISIVVVCNPDLQLARLRKRNPDLKEQQCRDRIASQIPVEKKAALSDTVIWNNGTVEDLRKEVDLVRMETEKRLRGSAISLSRYVLVVGGIAVGALWYFSFLAEKRPQAEVF